MEAQKEDLQITNEWSSSLWDCFSPTKTCALAWCCPCALLGKTSSRLEDPALKNYSYMNGDCCIYAATHYCYLCWVPLMMKRREIRRHFGIGGSSCNDCILACACPCCLLMQQEKEVEVQYIRLQSGYQAPAGMEYPTVSELPQ